MSSLDTKDLADSFVYRHLERTIQSPAVFILSLYNFPTFQFPNIITWKTWLLFYILNAEVFQSNSKSAI